MSGASFRHEMLLCTGPAANSEEQVAPGAPIPKAALGECRNEEMSFHLSQHILIC